MPIQLTVKSDAKLVRKGLEDLSREVPKIGRATIYEALLSAKQELSTPPSSRKAPGVWDSTKQQLAYFKSGGFGAGIPYKPTGKSSRSWVIRAAKNGWRLFNKFAQAVYLFGNYEGARQSKIHEGRRPVFKDTLEEHVKKLPPEVEKRVDYYARRKGF